MAVKTMRVCDVCGSPDAVEVNLTYDGESLTVDLCSDHVKPLEAIRKAAQAAPEAVTPAKATDGSLAPSVDTKSNGAVSDPKAIRAWAQGEGLSVPSRGRIPVDVLMAYRRAH